MLVFFGSFVLVLALAAETAPPVAVSAANPDIGVAPDSLATIYGDHLTSQTVVATSPPWPTSLGDLPGIWITDSTSKVQIASLLYVSPSQINLWIPPGVAAGAATITFGAPNTGSRTSSMDIQRVAPGLFNVDDHGTAAATAVRIVIATRIESQVPVYACAASGNCSPVPIDLGVDAPVYLSLYGTGIRGASSLSNVVVTIGTIKIQPIYAGPQPQFPGLDQINVPLPLSLRGSGLVSVTATVDGVTSNAVKINIQ